MYLPFSRRLLLLVILFLTLFSALPATLTAQEEEPEPGATAATGLPDASVLGEGWVLSEVISPDAIEPYGFTMSPDVFSEGAAGIYLGPEGSRVLVVNLIVSNNRVAIRASWDDASELLQAVSRPINTDYERDQELETMPPGEGCMEAKRVEGSEAVYRLPAGATLCAVDDDTLLLVATYGSVNGQTGIAASDALATQMVTMVSTPAP